LRRDLRAITADGAAASVMVGIGETYLPAFVLALTANQVASGLVATLPMFLGAMVQLVSPYAVRHWHSYRRWVVLCAVFQAAAFLPLVVAAWSGSMPCVAVFAIASVYWGTGMAGGSSWNTWVGPLVPSRVHARYFARRTLLSQSAQVLAFVAGGVSLQWGTAWGEPLRPFALLFLAAAMSRFLSSYVLSIQSEPCPPGDELVTLKLRQLASRVRQDRIGRMLLYMLAVQSSVQIAAPYFTPYMLRHLEFSYWEYVVLICAAYLAKIACLPWLGRLIDRWGAKHVLWLSGLAISPVPALWLVSDSIAYLLGLQMFSGAVWGGFELSMLLLFFETLPRHQRVSILTVFNLANATAVLLGSLAGGMLLSAMYSSPQAYWTIFVISSFARLAALGLLVRLPQGVFRRTVLSPRPVTAHWRVGSPERAVAPGVQLRVVAQRPHWAKAAGPEPRPEGPLVAEVDEPNRKCA
jgi:MFS family permease